MILGLMLLLALLLSLPILLVFLVPFHPVQSRQTTLALYRDQLAELKQDQALGRINSNELASAELEIQRRLLVADKLPADSHTGSAKFLLILTIIVLPIGGFILYLPGSTPFLPSVPHALLIKNQQLVQQKLAGLIAVLREHLAQVPPDSANASQGQAYLAEALTEQAGIVTPQALDLFKQSLANAPAGASWRALDQKRITQAQSQTVP